MRIALSLLAALALAVPAAAEDSAAEQAPQIEIVVSETGGEPRQELRYDLAGITEQTTQMDMDMALSMGMAGQTFDQEMPTIRTGISIIDPEVNDDGNLRIGFRMDGMALVENGAEIDPMMRAQLDAAFSQMDNFAGTMVIDDRGKLVNSEFDLDSVAPALRQQLESTMQTMQQSVIPLPAEPVGVGAQWSVDMSVSMNGMTLEQTATYEVTDLGDGYVAISSTITQSAAQQTITMPDMPGASVELTSYNGTGTGTMRVQLNRAMPDGTFSLTSDTAMRTGEEMGMPMDMTMRMALEVEMTSAP
ncbi:MAG: hypothetical protein ACJAYU_002491 [Bradymonadia bacterium]|jgi:hypothetical protein